MHSIQRENLMEVPMIRTLSVVILLAFSMVLNSCAHSTRNQNLGQGIRENHEVTGKYRNLITDPNYHYYYAGPKSNPDVVMGLDKAFTLQSKFWHQIDLEKNKEQLEYWVTWGDRQSSRDGFAARYGGRFQGAYILDPEGKIIGDWWSKKDWGIFEFPGDNVIIAHPPRNTDNDRRWSRFY